MEYLIGRLLDNMVVNLDVQQEVADAIADLGLDYDILRNAEWDAGLGNGGAWKIGGLFSRFNGYSRGPRNRIWLEI